MRHWRQCAPASFRGWAANRVVVPLARANAAHADSLLAALAASPLSTRELQCWFAHYRRAPQTVRERMVSDPRLFLDALRANDEQRAGKILRDGPEGECVVDMRCLEAVIARLTGRVAALQSVPPALIAAVPRVWLALNILTIAIDRGDAHDPGCEFRTAVRTLQAQRHSLREISRLLRLSRNTVRRILREPDSNVAEALPYDEATLVPS